MTVTGSFAEELSRRLREQQMPLTVLHRRLAAYGSSVSLSTLSYWRSGQRRPEGEPSLKIVAAIEDILGCRTGELTDRVGPTRRTGPVGAEGALTQDAEVTREMDETYEALGFSGRPSLRPLSISTVADVAEDRRLTRHTTRAFVQVTQGTVTQIPIIECSEAPVATPPRITANAGAVIGRTYAHPSNRVCGAMLELDTPRSSPETFTFEWTTEFPEDCAESDGVGSGVSLRCRELLLWVRFQPTAIPTWVEEYIEDGDGERYETTVLHGVEHTVQRRNFGPGRVILRWGFDES